MAWERRHGQLYYYRKVREQGRVRSLYFGRGARAEAAAREDGCALPAPAELAEVGCKKEPVESALAAALPAEFGIVRHKKEPAACATGGEIRPVKKSAGGENAAVKKAGVAATDGAHSHEASKQVTDFRHIKKDPAAASVATSCNQKDAQPWPSFLEVLRAGRDYRALGLRYAAHTLPLPGESLAAWDARRVLACGADGSTHLARVNW